MREGGHNDRTSHNFSGADGLVLDRLSCHRRFTCGGDLAFYKATICIDTRMPGVGLLYHNTVDPIRWKVLQVCI